VTATIRYESEVADRFDALEARFKSTVGAEDPRLKSLVEALGPLQGLRLLDLGCGKGRFAARLRELGAEIVGLDRSRRMLEQAQGLSRVLGTSRSLPFPDRTFDGVVAVEVFQHLAPGTLDTVFQEVQRVLKPGGLVAIVDRNLLALEPGRPWCPSVVLKWIDERRGLWMYPAGGPTRERWFWPERFRHRLGRYVNEVRAEYLLTPEESAQWPLRALARGRRFVLWTGRVSGVAA
jgi:2-polyprenyl-6-hydroxyphenyl methylase/3-demethylubiquinone-9 3-methyltransferase